MSAPRDLLYFRLVDGRELRQRRLERGLTQSQLAEAVGKSKSAISQIERGVRPGTRPKPLYVGDDDPPDPSLLHELLEVLAEAEDSEFRPARRGPYEARQAVRDEGGYGGRVRGAR